MRGFQSVTLLAISAGVSGNLSTLCSKDGDAVVLSCPEGQFMKVDQATYGNTDQSQSCGGAPSALVASITPVNPPASVFAIVYPSGTVELEPIRQNGEDKIQFAANVFKMPQSVQGTKSSVTINYGTCKQKMGNYFNLSLYDKFDNLGPYADTVFDVSQYGIGVKRMYVNLTMPFESLEGKAAFIYDNDGEPLACGVLERFACKSVDVLARAETVCDGYQTCYLPTEGLLDAGELGDYDTGCAASSDYFNLSYSCSAPPSLQPTTRPTRHLGGFVTGQTGQPTGQPSRFPTSEPTNEPTTAGVERATFDFSGGCSGGSGVFQVDLFEDELVVLGVIPATTKGLRIELEAAGDLDIALYDTDNTTVFKEGSAVIYFCNPGDFATTNCGVGGNFPGKEMIAYKGIVVEYSGFEGVDGKFGNEYVEIPAATPANFVMGARAFTTGKGTVRYSFTGQDSDCCQGVKNACGGNFRTTVAYDEVTQLGVIPAGKLDLFVKLEANVDIDVQLYNIDKTDKFEQGEAVLAWCEDAATCNYGPLTTENPITGDYEGMTLEYSGWNGQRGYLGSEFIRVIGATKMDLSMGLLGFDPGSARVVYTYTEPQN